MAAPGAPPIVILPGFGNNAADYSAPFGQREQSLMHHLESRGFQVFVVQLERKDWINVARGIFTIGFWRSTLTTSPGYTWYLERVAATVKRALEATGASQVDLVAHSAGGWLARAYLADPLYMPPDAAAAATAAAVNLNSLAYGATVATAADAARRGAGAPSVAATVPPSAAAAAVAMAAAAAIGSTPNPLVRSLVTLGTPHFPPALGKARDMTGGALRWLDACHPGAHFGGHGVRYVCVAGRSVRGSRPSAAAKAATAAAAAKVEQEGGGTAAKKKGGPVRSVSHYAADSYTQVCGDGEGVVGDAVVPLHCALLPGARHIVLDGVFHSMSRVGTFEDDSGLVWYGSDDVIDHWLDALSP